MPTTELILWKNNFLSKQNINRIHEKIHSDLGLELLSEEQEQNDEEQARLIIADAVKQIREKTRDNLILFNYNCNFGFIRNYMGASIWALVIVLGIGILNLVRPLIDNRLILLVLLLILISFPISLLIMKQNGREYARQLFTAYLEL